MSKIIILATGGTIACVQTDKGYVPGLTGQQLVQQIPQLSEMGEVQARQLMNIDSSDMRVSDWRTIARAVYNESDYFDGVVITHGTDTMCYTAAALSFMLSNLKIPVVLTGAQMPLTIADSDGPRNVLAAVAVAQSGVPGVQVVFNNKIINGSRAFKMYAKNSDAYVSRNFPYLGSVLPDFTIDRQATAKVLRNERPLITNLCEDVILLKITPATSPSILDHIAREGYRGVVIEGFGTGGIANLNRGMLDGIRYLTDNLQVPVVMISQCPYDGVNLAVYGVGEQASSVGVIPGNDMTTETAVVKLMWALGLSNDLATIRELMLTNFCDEITV